MSYWFIDRKSSVACIDQTSVFLSSLSFKLRDKVQISEVELLYLWLYERRDTPTSQTCSDMFNMHIFTQHATIKCASKNRCWPVLVIVIH